MTGMESTLFGFAIGSFIAAFLCACIAGVLFKKLGVLDAINFLRNKKVATTSSSRSRKRPSRTDAPKEKKPEKVETKSEPPAKSSENAKVDTSKEVTVDDDEDSELATSLLQETSEASTQLLESEDSETPTSLLVEEDTEQATKPLNANELVTGNVSGNEMQSDFYFKVVKSVVVVNTEEEI